MTGLKKQILFFLPLLFFSSLTEAQLPDKQVYLSLKKMIENALMLKMDLKIGEFEEWQSGRKVRSVIISGEKIVNSGEDPVADLYKALEAGGWNSNFEYSADGPDGTVFSYIKGKTICVFDIGWSPGHEDGLSEEEEEKLAREPVKYSITLYCFLNK